MVRFGFLLVWVLASAKGVFAQPGLPPPPAGGASLDVVVMLLLITGVVYGVYHMRTKRVKEQT